ncbi:MAG: alpha/beta hydrolase [Verrucomicrobia bacterium]|nr:alpha/beta hydrolase [Verrucomicrobiota bacterium]
MLSFLSATHKVRTPVAEIGYFDDGPADGFPLVLLHGYPDDAQTWDGVVTELRAAAPGLRLLRPFQRGCGPSRVTAPDAASGECAALAQDAFDFVDALGLGEQRFLLVGHDWGSRALHAAAVLAPERLARAGFVAVGSPYGRPPEWGEGHFQQARSFWYQWWFQQAAGRAALEKDAGGLADFLWRMWSPTWQFDPAELAAVTPSFLNPQYVDTVLHSYRHRWGNAPSCPRYDAASARVQSNPPIPVPATFIAGAADACTPPALYRENQALYAAGVRWVELPEVGHFPQREAPTAVAREILEHLRERGLEVFARAGE